MSNSTLNRRNFIIGTGAAAAGLVAASYAKEKKTKTKPMSSGSKGKKIKQVIAGWCFTMQGPKWDVETLCKTAVELGCEGIELLPPKHWDVVKKHNLVCAATPSHKFIRGMNNPKHWKECHGKLTEAINATSKAGFPNVMTFTGFLDTTNEGGSKVSLEEGIKNCVDGYKKIIGLAEKKKVTLVLEPLNTRDATPMKGHPGYMGDHVDICMDIIKKVDSPNLKLLFDVYHVQIMDGDLVRRIHEVKDYIGHVQIAGNPGRGEIGESQEINYRAVMQAFVDIGYKGYVGHEWISTGDAHKELKESVAICNV